MEISQLQNMKRHPANDLLSFYERDRKRQIADGTEQSTGALAGRRESISAVSDMLPLRFLHVSVHIVLSVFIRLMLSIFRILFITDILEKWEYNTYNAIAYM